MDRASTGEEFYDIIKDNEYDIILLDLLLPDISGIEIIEASYHSRWTYTVKGYNSEYSFHCDDEYIRGVIDAPPSEIKKEWCAVLIHGGSEKTNVMVDFQTTSLGSYFYGFKSVTHPILKTFETEEEALDYLIENGEEICKIISINKCLSSRVLAEKIRRTLLKDN